MKLRLIGPADAYYLIRWRNSNAEYFPPRDEPLTYHEHMDWYDSTYRWNPMDLMYMVCTDGGYPVGCLSVDIECGVIGRVILGEREVAPAGIMSEALQTLMIRIGRRRYSLEVLKDNARAIQFYVNNGFTVAGKHGPLLTLTWRDFE